MSHIPRIATLSLAALLMFFSCSLPGSGNSGNPGTTDSRSLAEVVADDYIAQIQATDYSRSLVNNKLSSSDIAQIRSAIAARVNSDGLSKSKDIDKVLPSVMKGIAAGADAFQASSGDSRVAASLLSAGVKCSATALSKHSDQLSDTTVTLSSVVNAVVTVGMDKLATLAKDDPASASAAVQAVVEQVSAELKPLAAKITAKEVLKVVVHVTVDAAVLAKVTDLVQDAFAGAAKATSDAAVVTDVVQNAVSQAKAADSSVDCVDLLKRAAAGLGDKATDQVLTDAAAAVATATSTVIDTTAVTEIKAVATETEPTASLTAALEDGTAVTGSDLEYKAGGHSITFSFDGTANAGDTADFELTEHDGTVETATAKGKIVVVLTGSGTFLIQLKVKNHHGMKHHRAFVVIVVKPKPDEKAPTASLVIKEGSAEVTGALAWNKAGHSLTIDTTASTGDGAITRSLTSTADAKITETATPGVYTVVQTASSVTYTLFAKNASGIKSASATKVVTIAEEPAPTAVLSIATDKGAPVTGALEYNGTALTFGVSSLGSTADTTKTLTVVPAATVVDNGDGTWTVTGVTASSTFTLKVTNNGGAKSAIAAKTVTLTLAASAYVKAGLDLLEKSKFDEAKAQFTAAILADPTDNAAKVWLSYLELAALTVNPDVISIMKDNLGVVSYPATMNELFSTSWMASKAYGSTTGIQKAFVGSQRNLVRGNLVDVDPKDYWSSYVSYFEASGDSYSTSGKYFEPSESGSVYAESWSRSNADGGESFEAETYLAAHSTVQGYFRSYNLVDALHYSFFPTIAPVAGFVAYDASKAATGYTMTDWMRLAMINAVIHNPTGFNALVDKVAAAGSFQTAFQTALNRLKSVDATYRATVPASLLTAWFGTATPVAVTIGKPELELQAASLQMTTSFLQYLSSVNFSYPLTSAVAAFMKTPYLEDSDDGVAAGLLKAAADSTPGLYHSTLLTSRSDTQRAASKATFLAALTSLTTAVDLYLAALADDESYYAATIVPFFAPITGSPDAAALQSMVVTGLGNAKTALGKASAAVSGGTTLIIPLAEIQKGPSALLGGTLAWPDAEAANGATLAVKPAAFWAENFLDLRSWLETDSKGFKPYLTGSYSASFEVSPGNYVYFESTQTTPIALPADRSQITTAALGVMDLTSASDSDGWLQLSFKPKLSMYQKLVPGGSLPPNAYLTTASWRFVDTAYDSESGTSSLVLSLTPPAGVEALLAWFNK